MYVSTRSCFRTPFLVGQKGLALPTLNSFASDFCLQKYRGVCSLLREFFLLIAPDSLTRCQRLSGGQMKNLRCRLQVKAGKVSGTSRWVLWRRLRWLSSDTLLAEHFRRQPRSHVERRLFAFGGHDTSDKMTHLAS